MLQIPASGIHTIQSNVGVRLHNLLLFHRDLLIHLDLTLLEADPLDPVQLGKHKQSACQDQKHQQFHHKQHAPFRLSFFLWGFSASVRRLLVIAIIGALLITSRIPLLVTALAVTALLLTSARAILLIASLPCLAVAALLVAILAIWTLLVAALAVGSLAVTALAVWSLAVAVIDILSVTSLITFSL